MTATILGAGYMGGAMSFPLADVGLDVRLWGTELDDEIIDESRTGRHPRLKRELPETVRLYGSPELEEAVAGAEAIFVGVSSEGFLPVFQRLLDVQNDNVPVFTLTKGFCNLEGRVERVSSAAAILFRRRFGDDDLRWTSIGGPVKAYELARGVPSPAIYASVDSSAIALGQSFQTDYYSIRITGDVAGVELCSGLKNVYAMAIGMCDGLYEQTMPNSYHNFSSGLFAQAIREMAQIVSEEGGRSDTVHGLAGIGDLYVTAQSGKNQRFGRLIGEGMTPEQAYQHMDQEGELAEGYLALRAGWSWLCRNHPNLIDDLPLFRTLFEISCQGAPLESSLKEVVSLTGPPGAAPKSNRRDS